MSEQSGLTTGEGVDEGSADSAAEGLEQHTEAGTDVVGEPPRGAPDDEQSVAAPVDMESQDSRQARDERGAGQQYSTGEG